MERLAKIGPQGPHHRPPMGHNPYVGHHQGKIGLKVKPNPGDAPPPFKKAVVFGATGGVGRALVKDLCERGVPTRVVSRSLESLRRNFAEGILELFPADIRNPRAAAVAAEGCDMIFLCAGIPLHKYEDHVLMARGVSQAMMLNHAKCLCTSGYWSYAPFDRCPVPEEKLRRPPSRLAMLRQIQEDILVSAGACVAMLPDFYGPDASISMVNDAILAIAKSSTAYWPGNPEAPRDFLFMPDAGRPLVELAMRKDSFGRRVNLTGSGPMQPRLILEAAAARLNEPLKLRAASLWMVKVAGKFNRKYREFIDLYDIYNNPAFMDGGLAKSLIGPYHTTPYPQAIDRTIRWMTGSSDSMAA